MSVVIYGEQGCGKTTNADALARHFGLSNIIDEWIPGQELPENTLALTSEPGIEGALDFHEVMLAMQSASA